MIFLLLAACGTSADDSGAAADAPYEPAPYLVEEEDPPEPSFDADALADAIDQGLVAALAIQAEPVFAPYAQVMTAADAACPSYYEADGNVYWYDVCTSDAGTSFNGYSFYYLYDQYDGGDGILYDGQAISGVATVTEPDGHVFEAGGTAYHLSGENADYLIWYSIVQGGFSWDGEGSEGTWLAGGLAPTMAMTAYYVKAMDGRAFMVEGGVSGLAGDFDTVVLDGIVVWSDNVGAACPEEPGGSVSVRGADGGWYDVLFDGEQEYGEGLPDPDACDGCGQAYFRGAPLGEVCVDFTWLAEWEVSPW